MKCTKFKFSLLLIVLMAMVFTMACKTKSSGEFKPKLYYTIDGVVKTITGANLQNVRVEVKDYTMENSSASKPTGTFATLTDADGEFSLEIIAYDRLDKVSLEFTRDGYTPNHLTVGVMQDQTITISAVLQTSGSFQVIDATADTTVTGSGGASVTISANTLRTAAGAAVTGARVSVTGVDTTARLDLLPGELYGFDNGSLKLFSTYGMIEIKVQDGEGNPLKLASGATATISIPVGEIVGTNPPATTNLWYYDKDGAQWLPQPGSLTLNNAGTAYEGTITHFSIFNAGNKYDATFIKGNVVDQAGNGIYNAEVSIFTSLFSNYGVWQTKYTTGPDIGEWPSILNTDLSGVVPENMKGYIPVPAGLELNVYIKYINKKDNNKLFECRSGQPAPAEGVEDTRKPCEMPFVTGAAGASTIYTGAPVVFETATDVIINATVKFEDGTAGAGLWFYFWTATSWPGTSGPTAWGVTDANGNLTVQSGWGAGTDKNFPVSKETEFFMHVSNAWGGKPGIPVKSWFITPPVGAVTVPPVAVIGGEEQANTRAWTSGLAGEIYRFEITLVKQSTGGPVETPYSYVRGTAYLENGSVAPKGSWVIFAGTYSGTPVLYRAQVGDNGVFPDPNGNFDVEQVAGQYYVKMAAKIKYTVTLADYATNPTSPVILASYEYTSPEKDTTGTLTVGPNTTVSGRVYRNGTIGNDLLVTFTKVNAVTECITDKNDPDYDEDCKVDVPVTAVTDTTGFYSVKVEVNTKYTVTVSEYATIDNKKVATNILYTYVYTSNADASPDTDENITIGVTYKPIATVNGTVVYDGKLGDDLYVRFAKVTPNAGDQPVYAITDGDGKYSANLSPATQYIVTVYEDYYGDPIYPSVTFPGPGGGNLLFTTSNIDTNIDGKTDKLDIQIGKGMEENPYTLSLPVGKAGVGGTLKNADGTPAAIGTLIYFLKDGGNPQTDAIWAIVNDDKGTYFATTSSFAATKNPVALDPATTYSVRYLNFTTFATTILNTGFTSDSAGLLQTVLVAFPETGASPSTKAYATGTLKNADGTPAAIGTLIYFLKDGGNPQTDAIWAIVNDDKGKYFATTSSFAATGNPVALDSATTYSVRYLNFTTFATTVLNAGFTSGGAGVQQTVLVAFPETGASPSTKAYTTGVLLNANGTPAAIGTLIYFLKDGGNPQTDAIWAIVNDDKGKYFATTSSFAATGNPVALDSATTYSVRYLNFTTFATTVLNAGFTSGGAGVEQTLIVAFP